MSNQTPSYRMLYRFFRPLWVTSVVITLSHSVVNAGVARGPDPEIGMAAYALARSVAKLVENPIFMVKQTVTSLVTDEDSFELVRRFVYMIAAVAAIIIAILGFSPLGYRVLHNAIGASEEISMHAQMALKVLFLLPVTSVVRNVYQGLAISVRQTSLLPISTGVRLVVMSGLIFCLVHCTSLPGALSASISFIGAFAIEALIMRWHARPLLNQLATSEVRSHAPLTNSAMIRFFLPLALSTFVGNAFEPAINIGLAHSLQPEITLAGYAVGHSLVMLVLSPIGMLHQCSLAFIRVGVWETHTTVKRFVLFFSVSGSLVLLAVSFSRVGPWILTRLMGVSCAIRDSALPVMQVLSILPLICGWREYMVGTLMKLQHTRIIGVAKTVNIIVLATVLVLFILVERFIPAHVGGWALVLGELADCIMVHVYYLKTVTTASDATLETHDL